MIYNKQFEKAYVKVARFEELVQAEKDLKKAKALIARLRAENIVLKSSKISFINFLESMKPYKHFQSYTSKYTIAMLILKFKKACVI